MGVMWRIERFHRRIAARARALKMLETADSMVSADDGKGVVLSLLRTREGSNILAEAYYYICLFLFPAYFFSGKGFGEGKPCEVEARAGLTGGGGGLVKMCSNLNKTKLKSILLSDLPEA